MPRLRRLLVLFFTCLGLVALPMRGREPCCNDDGASEVEHGEQGSAEQACLSGVDEGDECEDACLACCPQPLLATAAPVPVLVLRVVTDARGDAPARGPPHRDPDEQLQVPRAA